MRALTVAHGGVGFKISSLPPPVGFGVDFDGEAGGKLTFPSTTGATTLRCGIREVAVSS